MVLRVMSCRELLADGYEGAAVLRSLMLMDYEALSHLGENDEGTFEQWLPIFMRQQEQARYVVTLTGEIAGYWHVEALNTDLATRFENGLLNDVDLRVADLPLMDTPGDYSIYFVQFLLRTEWRTEETKKVLFDSFLKVMVELMARGIYWRRFYAKCYSRGGERFCGRMGLRRMPLAGRVGFYRGTDTDVFMGEFGSRLKWIMANRD